MINYSFIIPHYNSPELLNRLLDSIPQREDIEVVVVDDNSNLDKKPNVSRSDVKIIYLQAKESKGAGRARNIGLKHANGKWLLFADSDDYYINNFVDKLDLFKNTEYDIIFFDYDTNLSSKQTVFHERLTQMLHGGKRDRANFKHSLNAPWNKMYKREFIKDNNIFFEEIPIQNDAYFVHKASSLTDNFYYINNKLYFYEINLNGITRKKNRNIEDVKRSITTTIYTDKLKAISGAWDCILLTLNKQYKPNYGIIFYYQQQLRRVKSGLIWYMINKFIHKRILKNK